MAVSVRIELGSVDDARDLVDALARRGLTGTVVPADGSAAGVEIAYRREDPRRLVPEVREALATWLADRGRPAAGLCVDGRRQLVTAPPAAATHVARNGARRPWARAAPSGWSGGDVPTGGVGLDSAVAGGLASGAGGRR